LEVSGQLHAPAALSLERVPGTNLKGDLLGLGARLDVITKRRMSLFEVEPPLL